MKIVKPSYELLTEIEHDKILSIIERAARTCYKSEDAITSESGAKMIKSLIAKGHTAMLEHASLSVKFICDRGVSHEIVRHRIASYAQESTRYCNYSQDKFGQEITVIAPLYLQFGTPEWNIWKIACENCESAYFALLKCGCKPQEARAVLPNSLKTEIVVTMNLREWMHFFNLRAIGTTGAPHPQMEEVAAKVLYKFAQKLPEIFGEQYKLYKEKHKMD